MAKNTRLSLIIAVVFLALLTLIGCDINEMTAAKTGSIEIAVANGVKERGFAPAISMKIHTYAISGTGPGDASFGPITLTEGSEVIDNLIPGAWDITVIGRNEAGTEIGMGVMPVTIIAGHTLKKTVFVEEIGGTGSFSLTLELPDGTSVPAKAELVLYQENKEPVSLTFDQTEDPAGTLTIKTGSLASGFYTIAVLLYASEEEGTEPFWGNAYSLRIVQSQVTEGTITLTKEDIATFGGLDLTIIDGMPVPFTVGLSSTRDLVGKEETVTFTAKPSLSGGTYTYWWFLDGKRLEDEASKTLTLSDNLALGRHNVSVVAIRAGVMASDSKTFIKTDEPSSPIDGATINGVYLYPVEVEEILNNLRVDELPTQRGVLFLSPHAIESPNSTESTPYSYEIMLQYGRDVITEVVLADGQFAAFIPITQSEQGTYRVEARQLEGGSVYDTLKINLELEEEGPTVCWLDKADMSSTSWCLNSIETMGIIGLIQSQYPLTREDGTPLTSSDFYSPDGYIDSVDESPWRDGYAYHITLKSDYNGTEPEKQFALYAASSVKVDGRRPLANHQIMKLRLYRLVIPELKYGHYLDMENNVMKTGYYQTNSKEFKLSIDKGYTFAGWAGEDGSFFSGHATPTWPNKQSFANTTDIPVPIIVANDVPKLNAFFFDRGQYNGGQWPSVVRGPLGTETLKLIFSEKVTSSEGTITQDNFTITGATITSVNTNGNIVEATVENFGEGSFSLSIKDIQTATGGLSIAGQTEVSSFIVRLAVDNDQAYGTVSDCAGPYFHADRVKVTVSPHSGYQVMRLHDPNGYYGNDVKLPGEPSTYTVTVTKQGQPDQPYTIRPEYI